MKETNRRYREQRKRTKKEKPDSFVKRSIRQTVICAAIFLISLPISSSHNALKPYISKVLVATSDISQARLHFGEMCLLLNDKYPRLAENAVWTSFVGIIKNEEPPAAQPIDTLQEMEDEPPLTAEEKLELVAKASSEEFVYPENVNMVMPLNGEVTSSFGGREHPVYGQEAEHYGVDIAGNRGDTVISTAPGKVIEVREDDIYGNCILIQHTERIKSFYAHLDKVCVVTDEIVGENTKIGEVGSTGVATGPHLHFGVRVDDEPVDPENYIKMVHRD